MLIQNIHFVDYINLLICLKIYVIVFLSSNEIKTNAIFSLWNKYNLKLHKAKNDVSKIIAKVLTYVKFWW